MRFRSVKSMVRRDLQGTQNPHAMLRHLWRNPKLIVRWALATCVVYGAMKFLEHLTGIPAVLGLAIFIGGAIALPVLGPNDGARKGDCSELDDKY